MYKEKFIEQCLYYEGIREGTPVHGQIVKIYNSIKPLPQKYTLKTSDAWCAAYLSAMAWKCSGGDPTAFPYECSCQRMIQKAKEQKIWIEDESIKLKEGWLIMYDWQDSGSGDSKGTADHVGLIYKVTAKTIYVIEGNNADSVKKRQIPINGKYIRGFIALRYTAAKRPKSAVVDNVARQVIRGQWGTGAKRRQLLESAGYDPSTVQKRVNELLSSMK